MNCPPTQPSVGNRGRTGMAVAREHRGWRERCSRCAPQTIRATASFDSPEQRTAAPLPADFSVGIRGAFPLPARLDPSLGEEAARIA